MFYKKSEVKKLRASEKKFLNTEKCRTLLFSLVLFAAFALLAYLFPYTGDDWGWGSQIGLDRLATWFADYNGRYAGNLLVMALTRSKLLSVLVMGVSLVCACLFPKLFASSKAFSSYALGTVLFLLIPREIFAQSVAWTSGFSNYVPPIILLMLYFVLVKNIFEDSLPVYNRFLPVPVAALGFLSALFMENVTLFAVAASFGIIAYVYVRFKKVYAVHVMHLSGSIAGAFLMFSNSAYGLIADKQDFYRTTVFERGFLVTLTEGFREVAERLFAENIIAASVFSLLLGALYLLYARSSESGRKKSVSCGAVCVNFICLVPFYCKGKLYDWDLFFESQAYAVITTLVLSAFVAAYFISAVAVVFFCVDCKAARRKALFLLLCIPLLLAPLMLVSPIGPRCFFPPYLLAMGVCVVLFSYLKESLKPDEARSKRISAFLLSVSAVLLCFLTGVYGVVHWHDVRRNELVKKQVDAGFKTAVMYYLPYTSYVWNGDPDIEPWNDHYRQFYGIDKSVKLKFIMRDSIDDFEKNFEG